MDFGPLSKEWAAIGSRTEINLWLSLALKGGRSKLHSPQSVLLPLRCTCSSSRWLLTYRQIYFATLNYSPSLPSGIFASKRTTEAVKLYFPRASAGCPPPPPALWNTVEFYLQMGSPLGILQLITNTCCRQRSNSSYSWTTTCFGTISESCLWWLNPSTSSLCLTELFGSNILQLFAAALIVCFFVHLLPTFSPHSLSRPLLMISKVFN